jgi:hypothetical protein
MQSCALLRIAAHYSADDAELRFDEREKKYDAMPCFAKAVPGSA